MYLENTLLPLTVTVLVLMTDALIDRFKARLIEGIESFTKSCIFISKLNCIILLNNFPSNCTLYTKIV